MIWLIWSNGEEYGCCKSWDESWKAITTLQRNGYEVWEFDMTDFRKVDFEQFGTLDLEELERMAILKALDLKDWSQKNAASLLGVSPRSINYKIKKHDIVNIRTPNDGRSTWTKHFKRNPTNGEQ